MYYTNGLKDRNHKIISTDAEKIFEKEIQYLFIIKALEKLMIEEYSIW